MPRSFLAVVPGTDMWLHVVAKPGSVPLDWQQWSADSKQAALDRLQAEHEALRYKPGIRASVSTCGPTTTLCASLEKLKFVC